MIPRLIGFAGKMHCGKDTAGTHLIENHGFERLAFGDGVRHEVEAAIREQDFPLRATSVALSSCAPLNVAAALSKMTPEEVWKKPTSRNGRVVLQWWGTEYRRAQDPDYWIRVVEAHISAHPEKKFVITDTRFPNEADLIRKLGGVVWLIVGRGVDNGHVSENRDIGTPDRVIHNSGSKWAMFTQIETGLKEFGCR